MKKNYKKGAVNLIELLIYLVAIGVIVAGGFAVLSGKKDDATYKNGMDTFLQSFQEGMIKYSVDSTLADNNFKSASAANVSTFMNPTVIKLNGAYLTPVNPALENLIKVTVNPARDSAGNSDKRYKVLFDVSAYVTSNGWVATNVDDQPKIRKLESEIARFFKNISKDSIISGTATTLPAATTDATPSDPNTDGLIVIDRVK